MIYIDFNGRCGDQFFQYAFARKIQIHLNDVNPLSFNFYNQERWRKKINDESFKNNLQDFNVVRNISFINNKTNLERFGTKKQKSILKHYSFFKKLSVKTHLSVFAKQYQKKMQYNGIFYDDEFFELFNYPKKGVDVFLKGYFENYKNYYDDCQLIEALRKELTPKKITDDCFDSFLNCIKNNNSVCVSLRSWKEINFDSKTFTSRMICEKKYYFEAIEEMKKLQPDAVFIIFSDDIEWAKEIIGNSINAYYEKGSNTIAEKILLMSSCNHFILANSSFSWWTQYLSNYSNKIVVSPDRWYTDKQDNRLINPSWIIIKTKD